MRIQNAPNEERSVTRFRLKVIGKNQVTIPAGMMVALGLAKGDEIEITIEGGVIVAARTLKLLPVDAFPPDVLKEVQRRNKEIELGGAFQVTSVEQLRREGTQLANQQKRHKK